MKPFKNFFLLGLLLLFITPTTKAQTVYDDEYALNFMDFYSAELIKATEVKGFTIVPLKLYFNKRNYAKMDIAAAQGKKNYDKCNSIKERDTKRQLDRAMKDY